MFYCINILADIRKDRYIFIQTGISNIMTMQDKQQEQVRELTAEEKQRLEQIEITRRKSEKYLSLGDGEELTLRLNISKQNIKKWKVLWEKGKSGNTYFKSLFQIGTSSMKKSLS